MIEAWVSIKKLQLDNDPVIFVTHAKDFIEEAFTKLFKSIGIDQSKYEDVSSAFSENIDLFPTSFRNSKSELISLLSKFKEMDRPLDRYMGEYIDFEKIASEYTKQFDLALDLFKPKT